MLLLTAKDIQPLLGIDVEVVKTLMKNQVILSKKRKEILGTASEEYMTTPIVLQLGVRFLAYRNFQVTTKLNSQKLTLRCCYSQ